MDKDKEEIEVVTFNFDFDDNAQTDAPASAADKTGNSYVVAVGGELPSKSNNGSAINMTSTVRPSDLEKRIDQLMLQNSGGLENLPRGIRFRLRYISILLFHRPR